MPKELWGVNSSAHVTESLYNRVLNNFGKPRFWGRSLSTVPNETAGLTMEEINFLHQNSVKIIPIYHDFTNATGYRNGRVAAANAIFHAKRLYYPKGKFIFANTKKGINMDEAWIRGWVNTILPSGFRPGLCADPRTTTFNEAYCTAASNNREINNQLVIWSQETALGTTRREDAPAYKPATPICLANVWGWQYGTDGDECPIDTSLIEPRLFEYLW